MGVKRLVELSKRDPGASKRAAEGFGERLRQREREFAKESRSRSPSPGFYDRRFDI